MSLRAFSCRCCLSAALTGRMRSRICCTFGLFSPPPCGRAEAASGSRAVAAVALMNSRRCIVLTPEIFLELCKLLERLQRGGFLYVDLIQKFFRCILLHAEERHLNLVKSGVGRSRRGSDDALRREGEYNERIFGS